MGVKRNYIKEVHSQRNFPVDDGWPAGVAVHKKAAYAVVGDGDDIILYDAYGIGNQTAALTALATAGSTYTDITAGAGQLYVASGAVLGGAITSWEAQT